MKYPMLLQSKLVRVQEVAVWSNPSVSVVWILVSQMVLYYLCNWTVSLVSTVCYLVLSLYMYTTWVYTVWLAIKVSILSNMTTQLNDNH